MTAGTGLLPVRAAQDRLLGLAQPLPPIERPLLAATGHYLAAPLQALRDQPAAAVSAMDGYAIRWADRAGPWRLVGESAAGRPFAGTVGAGETARISTGALVPVGADTVLVQEDTARSGDQVLLSGDGPPGPGAHIRARASDFAHGEALAEPGRRIDARLIALAAMAGHAALPVHRPPRVVLLDTGSELHAPGSADSGIASQPASNGTMLAAMLAPLPCQARVAPIVADDRAALARALNDAADAEVIVTTGGASVGDHDLVRPVLADLGAELDFWRVAMRPGKPVLVARLGGAIVLGLPGNPVSAFVTATLFLMPLLRRLAGAPDPIVPPAVAPLAGALGGNGPRQDYLRAQLRDGTLHPLPRQDSAGLAALASADALIVRPPHADPAEPGTILPYLPLEGI